ncbi:hypothetical protein GTV32_16620 [Gordonia sp. SID5947]|uniref:TY-Chap domain-containing protein n=1 Tax=Gordonia sp. SID5947 TaxID=2690315 RepID=UPI001368E79C|nr:hypothetical protein [Gordonia sp. SID5947]MYR07823.1 hypothetical protein [Gordonia sp. SID5947]
MTLNDFDGELDAAWRRYRIDLADRLAGLVPGGAMEISTIRLDSSDEGQPLMTLTLTASRRFRCRVHATQLPADDRRPDHVRRLLDLGFRKLRGRDGDHVVDTGKRQVDRMASIVVTALREVWAVVHPEFLRAPHGVSMPAEPTIELATLAHDSTHLLSLVMETLEEFTGVPVHVDRHGEIPLPTDPVKSWLRANHDTASIECYTILADHVTSSGAADFVAANGRRWPGICLSIEDGRVHASHRVECSAYHPANFFAGLEIWDSFIRESASEIEDRCRRACQRPEPVHRGEMPTGLDGVLDLVDGDSDADGLTVAALCRYDEATIRRYLRHCAQQSRRCRGDERACRHVGDAAQAERRAEEAREWRHVIRCLGTALRALDDTPHRGHPEESGHEHTT